MATWKKIIVSGSQAELAGVTGSFTGSFFGDGTGLTNVTATPIFPTTAITNIATTDKFFINDDAGDATSGNKKITYANLLIDLAGTNLAVEAPGALTLASQISVTGVTASFNGNLTGTASVATTASFASTALYSGLIGTPAGIVSASVLSSPGQGQALLTTNGVAGSTIDLGLETGDSPQFVGLTLTGDIAVNGGDITTTAGTFNLVNGTATSVNFAGAATAISIGAATGNTTVNNNLIVTGDLTVNGTTTTIDTTNVTIEDRFIILNHGSGSVAPTSEGGFIVEGTSADTGSAFYYDGATVGRWAIASDVAASAISVAANSYMVTVSGSTGAPTGDPTYGGSTNGYGNMYVNTANGDVFIYS